MASRIQIRRDTAANWTSANPVLAQGEQGIETDTGNIKIGDGTTAWTSLVYASGTLIAPPPTGVAATDYANLSHLASLLPSTGGSITLRKGDYNITGNTLTFANPVKLTGQGSGDHISLNAATRIITTSTTGDTLVMSGHHSSIADLAVVNTSGTAPTAGTGIRWTAGNAARMDRVLTAGFYNNVSFEQSEYAVLSECLFIDPVNYGLWLRNLTNSDQGDMSIVGCSFSFSGTVSRTASAAVRWESGGGLKVSASKVNMGPSSVGKFAYGIDLEAADGVSTSVFTVNGCSIENCTTTGVRLGRAGTTGALKYVSITGNEFAADVTGIDIQVGASTGVIGNNVLATLTTGINFGATGGWRVSPNTFNTTTTPIAIGAISGYVDVLPQTITTLGTVLTDTSSGHVQANVDYNYGTPVPSTTGSNVTTLFRLGIPAYSALDMEFRVSGSVSGVGQYGLAYRRTLSRGSSGAATVSTPTGWTDSSTGTTPPTVTFDTATVSGEVQVKIQLGGGGTDVFGNARIRVHGQLASFRIGP